MTLDEAIRHCEEVADNCAVTECEMQHRQLAKWLKELKQRRIEQRWILCDQEQPNDDKPVLLTEEIRFPDGRRRRDVCMASYDSQNMTWYEILGVNTLEIPHPITWMPRPEPYKE